MANGPPSEKFSPWLKPLITPLTVGGRHFTTHLGAALPHVGSLQVTHWEILELDTKKGLRKEI